MSDAPDQQADPKRRASAWVVAGTLFIGIVSTAIKVGWQGAFDTPSKSGPADKPLPLGSIPPALPHASSASAAPSTSTSATPSSTASK